MPCPLFRGVLCKFPLTLWVIQRLILQLIPRLRHRNDPPGALPSSGDEQAAQCQQGRGHNHSLAFHACCSYNRKSPLVLSRPAVSPTSSLHCKNGFAHLSFPCVLAMWSALSPAGKLLLYTYPQPQCQAASDWARLGMEWEGGRDRQGGKGGGLQTERRGDSEQSSNPVKWIDWPCNCPAATVSWKNNVRPEDSLHLADESEQVQGSDRRPGGRKWRMAGEAPERPGLGSEISFFYVRQAQRPLNSSVQRRSPCRFTTEHNSRRQWIPQQEQDRQEAEAKGGGWGFWLNTTNHQGEELKGNENRQE